ncbi:MAG TPA: adenylate/guanylate cyclase domain-containing protein, partial [Flavobacteriales bacterium]|nr:adenylate/guanylate cyclase domain-containing protein [Flavobacteriales bacterium]
GLVLPYDKDHLTFRFSGLSLAYPEKVRFQTKLEGADADWSVISAQDRITYNALAPGTYTFLVKARNGSGVWNDQPARFTFTIAPPVWRTTPFLVGGALALGLLLFGWLRLRDRQARRERHRLERMVNDRTRELEVEKERSDSLLLNILPETTAAELKERGSTEARHYDECTVLFSDFQGFTTISETMEATGIVTELDRFFRAFDRLTDVHGLEKIKTIGDAYMCASGVPLPRADHAMDAVRMALEMLREVDRINAERAEEGKPAWPIRIGLHSGPLVAGVVGEKKFAYDIWGTTVNLASRMETNSEPGRVNCSATTYALIQDRVRCTPRGHIDVKGKGEVEMYFVDSLI